MSKKIEEIEEVEENIEEIIETDKSKSYLKKLQEMKLLNYDTYIPVETLEEIFGKKKKETCINKWAFFELLIRELIKSEGFFVTSRGQNNNLYILPESEMAKYNEKKLKVAFKNLQQRQKSLYLIKKANLDETAKKKLEFEILKNGSLEIEMHKQVFSRCRY